MPPTYNMNIRTTPTHWLTSRHGESSLRARTPPPRSVCRPTTARASQTVRSRHRRLAMSSGPVVPSPGGWLGGRTNTIGRHHRTDPAGWLLARPDLYCRIWAGRCANMHDRGNRRSEAVDRPPWSAERQRGCSLASRPFPTGASHCDPSRSPPMLRAPNRRTRASLQPVAVAPPSSSVRGARGRRRRSLPYPARGFQCEHRRGCAPRLRTSATTRVRRVDGRDI